MDELQISKFRKDFKSLVYKKGLITENGAYLKKLHSFDKNGSHNRAILLGLEKREQLKKDYADALNGKTYEEWRDFSSKLCKITAKLKRTQDRSIELINKAIDIEQQLLNLNF
jgi:hypothetical protein